MSRKSLPIIGAIGTAISLPAALVSTGLARLPVAILFAQMALKEKKNREGIIE
ncbi:MAG: hypothetical protein KAV87_22970 [Desulfobacteraceae bacterium]|nr:hypothetical protein [Desulfobacteraceae bacterium]